MMLYDFLDCVVEGTHIELFDLDKGDTVWNGYTDEVPDKFNDYEFCSVEVNGTRLVININKED